MQVPILHTAPATLVRLAKLIDAGNRGEQGKELGSVQPHPTPPVPGRHERARPKTGLSGLGLVFLGDIRGRIAPIGQRVPLTDQPAVQVRAVCGVANTERPHVAVPALNRAGDCIRADPHPKRLSGVFPTLIALAGRLPAGLRGLGGVNALEPHLLPRHFKRIGIDDPGHAAPDLNGAFAAAVRPRLGLASGRLPVLAGAGYLPFLMTMPFACDLAPLGTVCPAIVAAIGGGPAGMGQGWAGREYHAQQDQLDTPAKQMNAPVHFILL